MAHLGDVYSSNDKFFAKVDTTEAGTRFKMVGPRREDKQQAAQDLTDIRAAAGGEATRLSELRAMKGVANRLLAQAKAATRGGIKAVESGYRHRAVGGNKLYSYIGPTNRIFELNGSWAPMAAARFL